jgi:integrase/recombinase XerC
LLARVIATVMWSCRAGAVFCSPARGYRSSERHLGSATEGWNLRDLRHSRLTHAGEGGATEVDLMNLSGHEDRRTLQRYLKPSKEGTHRRLDQIDDQRDTWTPSAEDLAVRMTSR